MDLNKINSLADIEAMVEEFSSRGENQEYRYLLDKEIAEENISKLNDEISALETEISSIDTDIPAEGLKNDAEISARQEKIKLKNEKIAVLKELQAKLKAEERVVSEHDAKIIKKGMTEELGKSIRRAEDIERQMADLDKADPDAELPDATETEKNAYREAIEKAKKELKKELESLKEKAEQEKVEIRRNARTAYDYAINDRRDLRGERSAFFTQAKTKLENDKVAVEREVKLIELKADKYASMTSEQLAQAKAEMTAKLEDVSKAITSCQEQLGIIKEENNEEGKKYGLRTFQRRPDKTKGDKPEKPEKSEKPEDPKKGESGEEKGSETSVKKKELLGKIADLKGRLSDGKVPVEYREAVKLRIEELEQQVKNLDLPAINGNDVYSNANFWQKYLFKKEAYINKIGEEPRSILTKARIMFRNPALATTAAELITTGKIKVDDAEPVKTETEKKVVKTKQPEMWGDLTPEQQAEINKNIEEMLKNKPETGKPVEKEEVVK